MLVEIVQWNSWIVPKSAMGLMNNSKNKLNSKKNGFLSNPKCTLSKWYHLNVFFFFTIKNLNENIHKMHYLKKLYCLININL